MRTPPGTALAAYTLLACTSVAPAEARVVEARRGTPAGGLEQGLPRAGAYARGLARDAEGYHLEALRDYAEALEDLPLLARRLRASDERVLAWRAKIAWQKELSEELLEQEAYVSVMPTSVLAHYQLARVLHAKALSVRAFTGRLPERLVARAQRAYRTALELDPRYVPARLACARLWAEQGRAQEARREFAAVGGRRGEDEVALHVAAYHAALGERDEAFAHLARAVVRPEARRWAQVSNDFDRLRADPSDAERFTRLVGAPWRPADPE